MTAKDRLNSLQETYRNLESRLFEAVTDSEYHNLIFQSIKLKHELLGEIDMIQDPVLADLLYMHYIRFIPLNQISEMIGKEYRYTCKLHKKALREYEKALKDAVSKTNKSHFTGS